MPPEDLPGTSVRAPNKPGSKKCPHCGRWYTKPKCKKRRVARDTYHCPFCGKQVKAVTP